MVITEGNPVLEADETGPRGVTVHLTATVVGHYENVSGLKRALDALTDALIQGLWADYQPTVTAYTTLTGPDTQPYLTARIDLTTSITI